MLKRLLTGCDRLFNVEARQSIAYEKTLSRFIISRNWAGGAPGRWEWTWMNPQLINITTFWDPSLLQPASLISNIPK